MTLEEARAELERIAQRRVDPEVVREAVRDAFVRVVLADVGEALATAASTAPAPSPKTSE